MSETVLVTGGSGFVGMAIGEALLERGHKVILLGKAPSPYAARLADRDLRFAAGDLLDPETLRGLAHLGITRIIHGAAVTPASALSSEDAARVSKINVGAARAVADFAAANGIGQVCHLSSVSVYGTAQTDAEGRFCEATSLPSPDTLYGQTKLDAEIAMATVAARAGFRVTNLRLGPVFGPWEAPSESRTVTSPHHQCLADARSGRSTLLPRPLMGDWLYSADLAQSVAGLHDQAALPETLNLGSGSVTSVAQWCETLQEVFPRYRWAVDAGAPSIVIRYSSDRPALSTRRLDAALERRPQTPLLQAARGWLAFCTATSSDTERYAAS